MKGPLSRLTILETPGAVAVRYCGRLFAALGARVIAPATRPADERLGYTGEAGRAFGRWLDQGKVADAGDSPGGVDLVLAGQDSDAIALANERRHILATRPPLLALAWFAEDGPYGHWRGTDEIVNALAGVAWSFGEAEGPPMLAQGHAPQITAGLVAFNAGLAALLAPENARPSRIDVNVLEATLCLTETGAVAPRMEGVTAQRLGVNRFVPTYPCGAYAAVDGWIGLTCLTPAQWSALLRIIGRADVAADPRFATAYERLLIADEVDAILAPAIGGRGVAEWVALGLAHRIPIVEMARPGALPDMPHWRERGAFAPLDGFGAQAPTLPWRVRFDGRAQNRWPAGALPLDGVRVADFSMGWAGPLCARTLGDLGADVVKVESEGHPDWWRGWEAGSVDPALRETRHTFNAVNRNKRGVDFDLTRPEGLSAARALIASADVVVENFAAGVMDKLGLGFEAQADLRPGIVSVSMPAFGIGGPLSATRAYGSTVEQASGLPFVNGEAHWPPALQHIAFGDPIAGLYAAAAILSALAGRDQMGGAEIDLSQVACLFQLGADAIIADQLAGPVQRTGHARARLALCAVVSALDGWLAVAAGDTALAKLEQIAGGAGREALAAFTRDLAPDKAAGRLQAVGAPAAPVLGAHHLVDDPHLAATGFFGEMERAFVGRHRQPMAPFRFDGERPPLRRPAPTLGEHTAEVMAELEALGARA